VFFKTGSKKHNKTRARIALPKQRPPRAVLVFAQQNAHKQAKLFASGIDARLLRASRFS
jgi:hypothetical protein